MSAAIAKALIRSASAENAQLEEAVRALVADGVKRALDVERHADRWIVAEMTPESVASEVLR